MRYFGEMVNRLTLEVRGIGNREDTGEVYVEIGIPEIQNDEGKGAMFRINVGVALCLDVPIQFGTDDEMQAVFVEKAREKHCPKEEGPRIVTPDPSGKFNEGGRP